MKVAMPVLDGKQTMIATEFAFKPVLRPIQGMRIEEGMRNVLSFWIDTHNQASNRQNGALDAFAGRLV